MNSRLMNPAAAAGAALFALLLTGAVAVRADDPPATSRPAVQTEALAQMQARMRAMQAQMAQLQTATDAAERQKLLSAHMQLMQEQMASMRSMGGGMMQKMHGGAGMGMGMQPGTDAGARQPGARHQRVEDRMDMLQMMMEQMMGQMQMQTGPHRSGQ